MSHEGKRPKQSKPVQDIGLSDILEFLKDSSDFSFEMRVLKQISNLGFQCSHSGTYYDPITQKPRQYDIRAKKGQGNQSLSLSVECKSLSKAAPLLVSTTPRNLNDSYHSLLVMTEENTLPDVKLVSGFGTFYYGGYSGKKMNQVRRNDDGSLKGKDDEVFERLSQAQSSAFDLIQTAATVRDPNQTAAVVPMLVIPDETLWCVEYDSEGNPSEPKQRDEVSFFLGQPFL